MKKIEKELMRQGGFKGSVKQVTVGKHSINYLTIGKGEPLLCIHGINIGWGQWYKNLASLSKNNKVYGIDLPGSGFSSNIVFDHNVQDVFLDAVEGFIKKKKLASCVVLGHSIGGWVALRLARKYPKAVSKVVVVDSLGFDDFIPIPQRPLTIYPIAKFLSKTVMKPRIQGIRMFLSTAMKDPKKLEDIFVKYYYDVLRSGQEHPLMLMNALSDTFRISKRVHISDKDLALMKQSVLIVAGKDDPLVSIKRSKERYNLLQNASIEIISGAGHVPFLEKPGTFNKKVRTFLKN